MVWKTRAYQDGFTVYYANKKKATPLYWLINIQMFQSWVDFEEFSSNHRLIPHLYLKLFTAYKALKPHSNKLQATGHHFSRRHYSFHVAVSVHPSVGMLIHPWYLLIIDVFFYNTIGHCKCEYCYTVVLWWCSTASAHCPTVPYFCHVLAFGLVLFDVGLR